MKVVVNEDKVSTKKVYPYIGVSEDSSAIVLFVCKNTGTALKNKILPVGHYDNGWNEDGFTPLIGSITLSND